MTFNYFYGSEAEQFSFYRIPRALIKDKRFKKLSSDAKILYGLMLDRVTLSMKNGWIDEKGRAFIYFTVGDVMEELCCAKATSIKVMSELDTKKGIGLIEKKRQGLGRPDIIYVKDFTSCKDDGPDDEVELAEVQKLNFKEFVEQAQNDDGSKPEHSEVQNLNLWMSRNHTSVGSKTETAEVQDLKASYNNNNQIDMNQNESIHLSTPLEAFRKTKLRKKVQRDEMDKMDVNGLLDQIKSNIDYDQHMRYDSEGDRKRYDDLYRVIVDTVFGRRDAIRIGEGVYPYEVVKSRMLELNGGHLEYVRQRIAENEGEVRNMKQYMLAALYNAPATMETYYAQLVRHDMYGGGWAEEGIV